MFKNLILLGLVCCSLPSYSQVKSQSFSVKPENGGFSLALGIDGRERNNLVMSTLGTYNVVGKSVSTVGVLSVNSRGEKVAAGVGLLVPLKKVFSGVELSVGGYFEGIDDRVSMNEKFRALVQAKINVDDLTKVLGFKL
jgi:hypothetical protein